MMCGGWTQEFQEVKANLDNNPNYIDVQQLVDTHQAKVGTSLSSEVKTLEALRYKTQVVAGLNFQVECRMNGSDTVTLVIWRKLDGTSQLSKVNGTEVA